MIAIRVEPQEPLVRDPGGVFSVPRVMFVELRVGAMIKRTHGASPGEPHGVSSWMSDEGGAGTLRERSTCTWRLGGTPRYG